MMNTPSFPKINLPPLPYHAGPGQVSYAIIIWLLGRVVDRFTFLCLPALNDFQYAAVKPQRRSVHMLRPSNIKMIFPNRLQIQSGKGMDTMKHVSFMIVMAALLLISSGCAYQLSPASSDLSPSLATGIETQNLALTDQDADSLGQETFLVQTEEIKRDGTIPEIEKDPVEVEQNNSQNMIDEALEHCEAAQNFRKQGNLDEALKELDQAYMLIMGVNTELLPALTQQKEDLRFMISKRIMEIYAARGSVVSGNHKAIPVTLNSYTQKEIDSFTIGRERQYFIQAYKRSGRYREQIVQELEAAGLPVELSWLPLIESGFKTRALSKARALGLWQFIPSTGYKFGLKRDTYIDERLDPEKATKAAIAYLKELHQLFGDWATVLAAYNCGEGRVLRIIRSQNVNYLDNFWDLYEKLPRETARYVPRFLACLHIVNHPEQYGLEKVVAQEPVPYESIQIEKQFHLADAADVLGVNEQELADLNPELRYRVLPETPYQLKVPQQKGELLIARLDAIPVSKVVRTQYVYHRVKSGETLSAIARSYRTNIRKIAHVNKIRRAGFVVAGTVLKIPQTGHLQVRSCSETQAPEMVAGIDTQLYRVKQGDSLWDIARKYKTTVRELRKVNDLRHNRLKVGQLLKVPRQSGKQLVHTGASESREHNNAVL